jgi:L-ascorbate metabolism protein UlaG (beta-lactamase superfamily)
VRVRRLDDYQSWAVQGGTIALGGAVVAIDPWLTPELHLPPGRWMFRRAHREPCAMSLDELARVSAVVLTAHFGDHLDPATLEVVPRDTPVFATPTAARIARKLGFREVREVRAGERVELAAGLEAIAVAPGFPYRHNSLGWWIEEPSSGARAYLETHVIDVEAVEALRAERGPLGALVLPVQRVRFAGIPIVMGAKQAARACARLAPTLALATGLDPGEAQGLLARTLVWASGSVADFEGALAAEAPSTRYLALGAGDAVEVPIGT